MKIFEYSILDAEKVIKEFSTNQKKGLDNNSVAKRQKEFGLNTLDLKELKTWHIFLRQFRSSFIYLLFAAMLITIFLREPVDTLMIFIFLLVNTMLGFFQEYRSEKTVKLLNKYSLPRTKVLRDGKIEQITSDKLVPGDIVILETGDKIPADIRIIEENNLIIDETILTGESITVYKISASLETLPSAYHEALNIVFSGTDVIKGKAKGVVLTTGKNTAFGEISKLTTETNKISDFEKTISRFSRFIIKLVGFTLLIVFLANIFIRKGNINILEVIIFLVALTVSVIPEALPLVMTFSLAKGARKLAKNKVIVKRLSAIEDLGGIEILCTDKTGTLTKNELTVANFYSDDAQETLFLANLASDFEIKEKTEPFDIALEKELNAKQVQKIKKARKIAEEPFDPKIRRNLVLAKIDNKNLLITRGAAEAIIEQCANIDNESKKNINDWVKREGELGHRILAIGYKDLGKNDENTNISDILGIDNFTFMGIISFVDPIKPSSFLAVKKAKKLGVRMIVITGDSLDVAGAVGSEIGLIDSPDKVISGKRWEDMNPEKQQRYLDNYSVFARVSPEQKFKIIESLQSKHSVGFLGEGINDAPALKIAGVSLVVDSAADIAREAADIVLLKKNLEIILDGIAEGRQVFANTTKYIIATLASNFGNFFAVATASLLIDFLPMLPIQILLLNLLSDTPMISISTDTVDADELISPKKYEVKDIIILAIVLGLISTIFDFIFFRMFFRMPPRVLQTNWFIGSVLTELVLIFSIRTKSLFIKGSRPSASLVLLSVTIFVLTIILPFTHFGQTVFQFIPPSKPNLILILTTVVFYFICTETVKLFYYKSKKNYEKIYQ